MFQGKTSVGQFLAPMLSKSLIDIDNDWLEKEWNTTVANKLAQLGDESFLDEEDRTVARLSVTDCVISLSGSVPLRPNGLKALSRNGLIVYLDTPHEAIVSRLNQMKVDRIVGMAELGDLREVLRRRYSVYENSFDVRVPISARDSPKDIAEKVALVVKGCSDQQPFFSTRGVKGFSYRQVLQRGIAPDGGLFLPQFIVPFFPEELGRLSSLSYVQRCRRVLEKFPGPAPWEMGQFLEEAYASFSHPDVLPLTRLGPGMWSLETWHGPTASFKDLSLQLLPKLMRELRSSSSLGLLVATSGDTGSAALDGFSREKDFPAVVLFPEHGVSQVQKLQMQSAPDNVCVIGVESDFDFCQSFVKKTLSSTRFEKLVTWTSANSINYGRLIPQVCFAVSSYLDVVKGTPGMKIGDPIDFVVPTGNFGNILSAILARRMGVPIRRLICASNENNVLTSFFETGLYDLRSRKFRQTMSPSIDILVSSNLERFLYLLFLDVVGSHEAASAKVSALMQSLKEKSYFQVTDPAVLKEMSSFIRSGYCTEQDTLKAIVSTFKQTGVLIDPHTAVAKHLADKFLEKHVPMVVCSTAHWGKFPEAMLLALSGKYVDNSSSLEYKFEELRRITGATPPPSISNLLDRKSIHSTVAKATEEDLNRVIEKYLIKHT